MMIYPLTIGAACLLTSIIGTFFVKLGKDNNVMNALYKGFIVSAVASLAILWPVTDHVIGFANEYNVNGNTFNGMDLYYCGVIGLVITGLLIWITEVQSTHTAREQFLTSNSNDFNELTRSTLPKYNSVFSR